MNKNQKTKEKTCAFYASDYHFEMISLPYINKKLDESKEVIILTENNLEGTIKTLVSKINLNQSKKENILKINWENNDLKKFKQIDKEMKNEKDIVIFVKGKENYIKNINENIEKWVQNNSNIKVIDCYDINEIDSNLSTVMSRYQNILNTSGEKRVENL